VQAAVWLRVRRRDRVREVLSLFAALFAPLVFDFAAAFVLDATGSYSIALVPAVVGGLVSCAGFYVILGRWPVVRFDLVVAMGALVWGGIVWTCTFLMMSERMLGR
jgi:hypothetical protein